MDILSEAILRPKVTKEEVNAAADSVAYDLILLESGPPAEPFLKELLHIAAYPANTTLALGRFCPRENINRITRREIVQFMASYFR